MFLSFILKGCCPTCRCIQLRQSAPRAPCSWRCTSCDEKMATYKRSLQWKAFYIFAAFLHSGKFSVKFFPGLFHHGEEVLVVAGPLHVPHVLPLKLDQVSLLAAASVQVQELQESGHIDDWQESKMIVVIFAVKFYSGKVAIYWCSAKVVAEAKMVKMVSIRSRILEKYTKNRVQSTFR